MSKKYKTAVIGCGRIGTLLEDDKLREHPCTHAGAIVKCSETVLIAGCDTDEDRLLLFGEKWGIKKLYSDYGELLKKEKPELLCIATWSHTHVDVILDAVKSGVRAILCEKPIALSVEDAVLAVETCYAAGVPLLVNHERRWDSTYIKILEMINAGEIGELRTIIGNVLTGEPVVENADIKKVGGGPLLHDGTHLVDIMRFLAGDIEWVVGEVDRKNKKNCVEDLAAGFMRFKCGALGFIEGGGRRGYFNFELDIQGSEGRILVGNGLLKFWKTAPSTRYSGFYDLTPETFPEVEGRVSPYLSGIRDLVLVLEGRKDNTSSGKDALKALEAIMAIYESARLGGNKVFLPLKIDYNPLEKMYS